MVLYRKLRWEIRELLGQFSWGMPLLAKNAKWAPYLINKRSTICIEGYPRSGNTFSVAAFLMKQADEHHVGRHTHLAGHVIRAVEAGVPTVVLVRNPLDAISSLLIRAPYLSPRQAIKSYFMFYEKLNLYKGQFVIAPFEQVIDHYSEIIEQVNNKFNTSFELYAGSDEEREECFRIIEQMDTADRSSAHVSDLHVARPTAARDQLKRKVSQILEQSQYKKSLTRAASAYHDFLV